MPLTTSIPRAASWSHFGGRRHCVAEVRDVLAESAEQQRLVDGHGAAGHHSDALTAELPTMAVGAANHVPTPPLSHPGYAR